MLREALGESPTTGQYVETEPKRGYRFVAGVRTLSGGNDTELVVQTRTRSSFVVEEETEDQTPARNVTSQLPWWRTAAMVTAC